jgi:hypothetical protein
LWALIVAASKLLGGPVDVKARLKESESKRSSADRWLGCVGHHLRRRKQRTECRS